MSKAIETSFVAGGGDMGAKVRAFDWATNPLGAISRWSGALRIAVDLVLASKIPSCLFWGPDLIAIYNDAYHPLLGAKPEALGQPLRVTWSEGWAQLQPIAEKAMAGESTFIEDYLLRVNRNGHLEDAWFTFNYGPVFDETGTVVGMLDTVIETTAKVLADVRSRAALERQQRLLQQMPGFACVLAGPRHVYEYVNDAYIKIAGPREFIGHPVREVFPELVRQGFHELLDQVYATGKPVRANAVPIEVDREGGSRFIDLLYEPIRDAADDVQGIFVGGYDVTDRVRAEAEVRHSEARLRALNADLEQRVIERTLAHGRTWQVTPEMLCVFNAEGHFETVNPAWEKTMGWSEAEMTRAVLQDLLHPDDLARTMAAWADATLHQQPVLRFENRHRDKSGNWHWLSWVAVPEDNKFYCIARDVTAEKQHEAALARRTAERDVLAAIVQTTDYFIQVLDRNYRILAINKANVDEFERIYGIRPAVGDNLLDLMGELPEQREAALALWGRAMAGESFTVQREFGDPNRARRTYEIKFEVLRDANGEQFGAFQTSTDITDRLREQRAHAETQEALRQSQKMEAVGQLTGGIAHDFNNLLAAISGSLQVMQMRMKRGKLDGIDRYLEMSEGSVRRAAALTQRLLAFSRRQTLDPKPVDVNRLVQGMSELIVRTVGPAVQVVVERAPDLWPTRIDSSQLENALLNLCINARDAMPSGGQLMIATCNESLEAHGAVPREPPPGDYVCLGVTDTGAGMTPEVVQRVFDPFFTTKPLGQGTGLGLSMVYGFVRQSGGQIRVESQVGRGTTMRLYLPRHMGEAPFEEPPTSPDTAGQGGGETVLLIEDEGTVRQVVDEVLKEAGYTVLAAEDGPSGLRMLQAAGRIDLLVTDVGLPGGMNGRQVADAGRALRPALKVLFITGYAETAAVRNGLVHDGMEVITKPFEIAALAAKVREMLDSGTGAL
ncbi:PAS domain-containing protein [Variovorax rhizosphaerae]|uniref:histidine kinase n=1 Tax=Variovorax rhizosphaerae TaxID=1836200 RepID=A0ABU8WXR5_9BURK